MSRKNLPKEKVIHVVFGPGGGRWDPALFGRNSDGSKLSREDLSALTQPEDSEDAASLGPVADVYTRSEVGRLMGFSASRLRTLDRSGIVSPSGRRQGRRAYNFSDLIALRTAKALFDKKVRLRDVTRAISCLREELPSIASPMREMQLLAEGGKIVVRSNAENFEAESGQLLLNLEVKELKDDIVRVLRPAAGRRNVKAAYELYLKASELDEDAQTMDEAVNLYKKAIELDPWLSIAHTNLGNIAFRRQLSHDAEAY